MNTQCVRQYYEQVDESLRQARLLLFAKSQDVLDLKPGETLKVTVDLTVEVTKDAVPECIQHEPTFA